MIRKRQDLGSFYVNSIPLRCVAKFETCISVDNKTDKVLDLINFRCGSDMKLYRIVVWNVLHTGDLWETNT